jgi:hypothetical protein
MMEVLLAMREDMRANQKTMDAHQAKMEALTEMTARMDANMRSMQAELKSAIEDLKINGEETMAYQEKTEARLQEEPASEDMTPEVAHEQEVPMEDAVVMPVGEPTKRRRDGRNLAAHCRQKEEGRDLDARRRGKQQDFVAAHRGTTRRAKVARRKENTVQHENRTFFKLKTGRWIMSRNIFVLMYQRHKLLDQGFLDKRASHSL